MVFMEAAITAHTFRVWLTHKGTCLSPLKSDGRPWKPCLASNSPSSCPEPSDFSESSVALASESPLGVVIAFWDIRTQSGGTQLRPLSILVFLHLFVVDSRVSSRAPIFGTRFLRGTRCSQSAQHVNSFGPPRRQCGSIGPAFSLANF